MRLARLIGPELRVLLREHPEDVRELLDEIHPEDLADIVDELSQEEAAALLSELPTEYGAQVFERLQAHDREDLAVLIGPEKTAAIAAEMDADERADFFEELPDALSDTLLAGVERIDPEAAEEIVELRKWPENSAGRLMTTEYITVSPNLTMAEAMAAIRLQARDAQTVDVTFVLEAGARIVGILSLRDVLLADPALRVAEVMRRNVISVTPELDQEEVAERLGKYDLGVLPVVTGHGQLIGVITADDVLDVLRDEQTEDVQRLGAVEPISEGYLAASVGTLFRKRAPWLLALFVGALLTTTAMQHYDGVLRSVAALAFYVPMLISAGGNSGSQSSTLVIRALALGELERRDWWRVLFREVCLGLSLGGVLAAFGVVRVLLMGEGLMFAALVAVTVVAIVLVGCVVGGMMPLVLSRLGLDPATSSTPFIATLVDVLGIVIYLGLAQLALGDLLAFAPPAALDPSVSKP